MNRRRIKLGVTVGAIVLVASGISGCDVFRQPDTSPSPGASADGDTGDRLFASLPASISVGSGAADLPTDRAVGRAAFVYTEHALGSAIHIVTVDGTPYRVGAQPTAIGAAGVSVSPDGRWLARKGEDGWSVRDLASTTKHTVDGPLHPSAWSVDGGSLLLFEPAPPGERVYQVMNTANGELTGTAFTGGINQSELIMLNDHELATYDAGGFFSNDRQFTVEIVDVRDGSTVRSSSVDLSAHLSPDEHTVAYILPKLAANGDPTRLWTSVTIVDPTPAPEATPNPEIGAIGIDVASGRFVTRVDWAGPQLGSVTSLAGAAPDGAVLAHMTMDATEISIVADDGERRVVTRLSGPVLVHATGIIF